MGDQWRAIDHQGCSSSDQSVPMKRRLIEVYSVRFCNEKWYKEGHSIFGFAELKPSAGGSQIQCPVPAVIFKRISQAFAIINKQGIVTLNGPTSGVEVNDEVAIDLCLWDLIFPRFNIEPASTLWRARDEGTDKLICKEVNSVFGPVEVVFAVYSDGVEAQLDVSLANWNADEGVVEAFGDVETGNSKIGGLRARSSLFRKSYEEAIQVEPGSDLMSLPLSTSVTVVPHGSALSVNVSIWRVENSCRHQIPIVAKLRFQPVPAAATETRVVYGDRGNVVVRVTWSG